MNFQLDKYVWFGNWTSPIELKDTVKTIINVSHYFSNRRGRNVYWSNLEQIPWRTFYVRLAAKDHDTIDKNYLTAFEDIVVNAKKMDKLPILCHCQMGKHRGPTAAIAVSWILNGKTIEALDNAYNTMIKIHPGMLKRNGLPYHKSMIDLMKYYSLNRIIE